MSRRIAEIYVGVVCLACVLLALLGAKDFLHARIALRYALEQQLVMLAEVKAVGQSWVEAHGSEESDAERRRADQRFDEASAKARAAEQEWETERQYVRFVGIVLAAHVLLLVVVEASAHVARRRSARADGIPDESGE